jgi:hypothetical protein
MFNLNRCFNAHQGFNGNSTCINLYDIHINSWSDSIMTTFETFYSISIDTTCNWWSDSMQRVKKGWSLMYNSPDSLSLARTVIGFVQAHHLHVWHWAATKQFGVCIQIPSWPFGPCASQTFHLVRVGLHWWIFLRRHMHPHQLEYKQLTLANTHAKWILTNTQSTPAYPVYQVSISPFFLDRWATRSSSARL